MGTLRSAVTTLIAAAALAVAGIGGATAACAATVTLPLATDAFSRTVGSGWGSADTGGAWTVSTPSAFSVNGSQGVVTVKPGWTQTATLTGVTSTSTDARATFGLSALPTANTQFVSLLARRVGSVDYRVQAKVATNGSVTLVLAGSATLRSTTLTGYTYAPGDGLTLRVQATGTNPTTLNAKAWKAGTAEPGTWQLSATDSTAALQSAGSPGMQTYLSSATAAPITLTMDDLSATTQGPAPNSPPVASFTSTVTGLAVAVDGTGSSDPDGTVVADAWTFGDGTTGTGPTATHTYAGAGTYPVTLTVTDDQGATATSTATVTVAAPPATALAADTFARSLAGGWGSADTGGAWTVSTPSAFSVNGAQGLVAVKSGWTQTATLNGVLSTSIDARASFGLSALPTANTQFVSLLARRVGTVDYRVQAKIAANGSVTLVLAGSATLRSTTVAGLTYAPGSGLTLRVQATGTNPTTLSAKAWTTGTTEPAGWLLTATDATAALQSAGSPGMQTYLSSASAGPITLSMDDLSATAIPSLGADVPPVASFTSSSALLVTAFDGTGSSDADGSVVGWSWDFGDGGVATGSTTSHTFRATGTYPVTLTVTDDRGATASTTSQVGVVDPTRPSKEQWLADVAAALNGASDVVDAGASVSRPAIVLDIDNTALESYYSPFAATPPVLALAQRASAEGYTVLFATGRAASDRAGTLSQLSAAGYATGDLCLRDPTVSVQDSKTACRVAWTAAGYTIVANVGNHTTDLAGASSGTTYLLPDYGYLD